MSHHVAPAWSLGILAGGKSRRMGQDKATVEIHPGRSLIRHVRERLAPPGIPCFVGVRDQESRRKLPAPDPGLHYVPDMIVGEGPLSSLCALMQAASTPWLLVVAVDQVLLPEDLGLRMLRASQAVDAVLIKGAGRTQPFPVLVATECAHKLVECFEGGQRRADCWHDQVASAEVPLEQLYPDVKPESFFWNANTPAELDVAREALRTGKFVGPMDG